MTGGTTKIRPKLQPRMLESPKWSVGEQNFPDRFSKNAIFGRTDSPRAKQRVRYGPFGDSIVGFWNYIFLSKKIVQKITDSCLASMTQIVLLCFEESILIFKGVRVLLQINMTKLKKQIFRPWQPCPSQSGCVSSIRL